ncbi:hypothetical protein KR018_002396, partial [Drosophila ironensis]
SKQIFNLQTWQSRVLTVLSFPLMDRISELTLMFERCPLRQLQEIFPQIVHSMFGVNGNPLGWGLRTTTMEHAPVQFQRLQQFFGVSGPWMHMCHSLLAEQCKFEVDVALLPTKFVSMMGAGTNPMFYADLINVDPMGKHLGTLSLNAFDFYVIHFVLYAMKPLHSINPIAMQINNVRAKTVYSKLVSEYLSNFLPLYPDARIEPMNISSGVKAPQPLPAQALHPQRQPRYLRIPSSYRLAGTVSGGGGALANSGSGSPQPGSGRAYSWRSESVLHFFVDIWLRCDIESEVHLPSSDFVRGVRTLIKQVHFFASTAQQDHTSICALRKASLSMVKARIYAFICGLIDRWPLDSSLMLVLELWLSYIQPWRYTMAALNHKTSNLAYQPPILPCFDAFIIDNLIMYTHIFVLLLPRFERLDYTVYRNAFMLFRLAMIFSQHDLIERLQRYERLNAGNSYGFDSPQRQVNLMNKSLSPGTQWSPVVTTNLPKLFSEPMHRHIENFLLLISLGRNAVLRDIAALKNQITERERAAGLLINLYNKFFGEYSQDEVTLRELSRIPEVLRQCIETFSITFNVDLANLSMHENLPDDPCPPESTSSKKFSFFDSSDSLDISKINPRQMSLNVSNMQATIDPAMLPIRTNEVKVLVRTLHSFSMKINQKYGSTIEAIYTRDDYVGKIAKRFLYGPMTEQWFSKRTGNPILRERSVPPRVCLRSLGSIPVLLTIGASLIFGKLLWGSWTFGFFLLVIIFVGCNMLLALFS